MIQAFIFDLDGVITETSEYHYLAWQRLADDEGLPFSRNKNEALKGISRRDSLLTLLEGRQVPEEEEIQALMARKNGYYVEYLQEMSPLNRLEGVTDFLQEARSIGIKLGIGSASKNAQLVLEKIALNQAFDAIGDGNCVKHSKPAPDIFVWTAGALGTAIQDAVVFEDAKAGIDAALRAGAYAVGIGKENLSHAHLVLENLVHTDPKQLIQRLQDAHLSFG